MRRRPRRTRAESGDATNAVDLRRSLVDAAATLIRTHGLATLTTRYITREARCSEGALYTHFPNKADLLFAVCQERLPHFRSMVGDLVSHVGRGTVQRNLEAIILAAQRFYAELMPISSAIAADRQLLLRHRAHMRDHDVGPRQTLAAVAAYIAAEQRIGRVDAHIAPEVYGTMLLGACFATASAELAMGAPVWQGDAGSYARALARALYDGMAPKPPRRRGTRGGRADG